MQKFRVGVDIGGTFSDIVFLADVGQVLSRKVSNTPDDYSRAVLNGINSGAQELGITAGMVSGAAARCKRWAPTWSKRSGRLSTSAGNTAWWWTRTH